MTCNREKKLVIKNMYTDHLNFLQYGMCVISIQFVFREMKLEIVS